MMVLANANQNTGALPAPVMTIIAMLLLMLPFLIKRYTGKSVTELLHPSAIFGALEKLADKVRNRVPGGGVLLRKAGIPDTRKEAGDAGKKAGQIKDKKEERSRTQAKRAAGSAQNDYLQTLSRLITFARKNRLFVIVPGNIRHGGETADLAAVLVTGSRVIGIAAYGFAGKILCRNDGGEWSVETPEGVRQVGSLSGEALRQQRILSGALKDHGLGDIPCETVMLFTARAAVLEGERPENAYTAEAFFREVDTDKDLSGGIPDPKETGRKIAALRAG